MRANAHRALAALAIVLGLGALLAGDRPAQSDRTVTAIELAGWIREQRAGLQVLDLRSAAEFEEYHIPGARIAPAEGAAQLSPDDSAVVVLYAVTEIEARRIRALLQRRGVPQVYELQGGLAAWLTDIMNPQIGAQPTPEEQRQYNRKRELADYFGGQASRFSEPGNISTDQLIKRLRRRGC